MLKRSQNCWKGHNSHSNDMSKADRTALLKMNMILVALRIKTRNDGHWLLSENCCRRTSRNGILRWDFFNLTFLLQIKKVMTEIEHFNFRQFCKAKGIDPKIWQKPHYLKIYIERYIYTKGTRKRKRCHFQMDSQDLQCTFNIDWWQWLTFFSCSLFFWPV